MTTTHNKEKSHETEVKIGTLLGTGTRFHGEMVGEGNIRIDGRFKGKITSKGSLYIGKTGEIEADIEIGSVVIGGKVKGSVAAKSKAELISPAKFLGNISTPRISIVDGVIFEGSCVMNTRKNPREPIAQLPNNTSDPQDEDVKV
ncbi:polymer-forming cytoskeletal protein [Candidatus Desantisbacteria bacterium]|nr:polymer-forming cytoskeletal protein [Candidatus Desantisbacteria bacterium]